MKQDYVEPKQRGRPPGMPGPFEGAPVTKWLIIINVAILFLQVLMTGPGDRVFLQHLGHFSIQESLPGLQLWRFLTFQFLHADFGHLIMNGIGLFFFGPHIERWMSARVFLVFYLLCGVAGALFYTVLFFVPGLFEGYTTEVPMVGASAGVFGILAAFYFVAPQARVLLFFVIPIQMRTLGIGYFIYEALSVLLNWHNAGGSAGHLGGAIFGLLVLKWAPLRKGVVKLSQIGAPSAPSGKGKRKTQDAKVIREDDRSPLEVTKEVDRLLDKISEQGIQSLTPQEKETLNNARRDK